MNRIHQSIGSLGLAACLSFCGCEKRISIRAVEPARKRITSVQRVAVVDLAYEPDPEVGRNIANAMVAELDQSGAFDIMERSAVARILEEQNLTAAGLTDASTVSTIGKLLGVDGMVIGEILVFDAGSQALGKYASVGVNVRLVDVRSARVIFSDSIIRDYTKFLDDTRGNVALNELSQLVAKAFVRKIAPHYVEREKFLISTGGDAGKANERGMRFASNRLWDKAQESFETAAGLDPENAAVLNNLAVCHEQFGRLDKAISAYEKAIALDPDSERIQQNLAGLRDTFRPPTRSAREVLEDHRRAGMTADAAASLAAY